MKKTITLALLLGAAVCAQAAELTLTPSDGEFASTAGTGGNAFTGNGASTNYVNTFTPVLTNLGNGGSWTWTATFDLAEAATIDSLKAGVLTFSTGGSSQGAPRSGSYTFSILDAQGTSLATSGATDVTFSGTGGYGSGSLSATVDYAANSISEGSGAVLTFSPADLTLEAGTYTLTLEVSDGNREGSGYLAGLHSAQVAYTPATSAGDNIPEPTTATLSLLALAGLAARRRRK